MHFNRAVTREQRIRVTEERGGSLGFYMVAATPRGIFGIGWVGKLTQPPPVMVARGVVLCVCVEEEGQEEEEGGGGNGEVEEGERGALVVRVWRVVGVGVIVLGHGLGGWCS
jgi:hypothetical protein